jgi:hypothetical protein
MSQCVGVCVGGTELSHLVCHISRVRVQGSTKDDGLGLVSWWR